MSRSIINLLLDAALLVVFVFLIGAAVIVRFVFPPGPEAIGWMLWGQTFQQWQTMQFGLVAVMALGVLVHVMLHWSWICGVISTRLPGGKRRKLDDGTQTLWGVGLLIVIVNVLGLSIAAAAIFIRPPTPSSTQVYRYTPEHLQGQIPPMATSTIGSVHSDMVPVSLEPMLAR